MMPRAKPFVRPEFTERFNQHLDTYKRRMERAGVQVTEQALATELGRYNRGTLSRWRKGNRVPDNALKKLCKLVPLTEAECQELRQLAGYIAVEPAAPETVTAAEQTLIDSIREAVAQAMPSPTPSMSTEEARALLEQLPEQDIPPRQTLPAPCRTRRLSGSQHFVGRDDELRQIARQLKAGGTVVVTTGIGGVGKTQLAIEALHRYGCYFGGGVFWLSFAEPSAIPQEIADCARELGLVRSDQHVDQEEALRRVYRVWESDLPRLLIFDNCDDHPEARADALLTRWLPETGACRVLVTSRHQGVWNTEREFTALQLDVLAREDSITLLQQLAPHLAHHEANLIAQKLGDLPLALYLAGHYLARYRIPVADYLTKLASAQLKHPALQGKSVGDIKPTDRELHVEKAFALSFERLNPNDPIDDLARQLLARAVCFAPGEPFGRNWLEATITPEGDEDEQRENRTDAVERLLDLGLLESVGEGGVRLHRLLAAYAALALNDAAALSAVERVVNEVAYLANETGVPQVMLPVLPHLRYLVQGAGGREDELTAMLCTNLGFYFNTVGAYEAARPLYERALAIRERVLGADHPQTATSLNNLAVLLEVQGAFGEARPLYERALAILERVLGADHPDAATSLNNLAGLLKAQGAFAEARPLYERALVIYERVLGADHPLTATSLNNLAELLRAQGAYEEARQLYERALSIYEQVLGENHPLMALSLNNLASLLQAQGASSQARSLYERSLGIRERVLGADHPDIAQSLGNLAELLRAQGAYEEARPLYERSVEIRERVLGADHPLTAMSLNNLAGLHYAQGFYREARPLYERALEIRERVLGADHPLTATSLNNLAYLLRAQGAYEEARPLYERALEIRKQVLGADHLLTATSLNNLAMFHIEQEEFSIALLLLEQAIAIWQVRLGPLHPDTMQAQQSLVALRQRIVIADFPEAVRTILKTQNGAALQQVLQLLPPEEARFIVERLQMVGILPKPDDDPFGPLLQAIVAVAQGDNRRCSQVEAMLAQLEQRGFHLTAPVQAIWTGERNAAKLTQGLDDQDTTLIHRLLTMLTEAEAAKGRADLLARAEARVTEAGDDPQARADLAERLAAVAASYASGSPEEQALVAHLQALIDQLRG